MHTLNTDWQRKGSQYTGAQEIDDLICTFSIEQHYLIYGVFDLFYVRCFSNCVTLVPYIIMLDQINSWDLDFR